MSRVVWKFAVPAGSDRTRMPADSRIVSVGEEDGTAYVWAEVHPFADDRFRALQVICTGDQVPAGHTHVGTVHVPLTGEVLHVYDGGEV